MEKTRVSPSKDWKRFLLAIIAIGLVVDGIFSSSMILHPNAQSTLALAPTISDFYLNATITPNSERFAFSCTDNVALDHAIFGCNTTGTFTNDTTTTLTGTSAWANYTHALPSSSANVTFQLWLFNSGSLSATTGLRYILVYTNTSAPYIYFNSLSSVLTTINNNYNWGAGTGADMYSQVILGKKTITDLENMIDSYAQSNDWVDVLKWSAFCVKMNITQFADVRADINYALGNYTMVGSLPFTQYDNVTPCFSPESKWALYGYYFANQSWALSYNSAITTKWNITAAYNMYNSSCYGGDVLYVYASGGTRTYSNRFYDEEACPIDCFLIFDELLNVTDAMKGALNIWTVEEVGQHWDSTHNYFTYTPEATFPAYECEASFFLMIISELCYYYPSLSDWNLVLEDIGNRFLANMWNSPQWLNSTGTSSEYVVVHEYNQNPQLRLQNTLGTWEALLGVYNVLSSSYQSNLQQMLAGTLSTPPAWDCLISSALFSLANDEFYLTTGGLLDDNSATSYGMILLALMGIVPRTTTIAFPLEELNYEYIQSIDPVVFQFVHTLTALSLTLLVANPGTITFQYGYSPVTYNFTSTGLYTVYFTNSWNLIMNATYLGALPSSVIYFNQISARAIYILADGSIDPQTAPISTPDGITYTLTGAISNDTDGIVIERDNIILDGAGYTVTGSGSGDGTTLTSISNVTVRNMTMKNFTYGIYLDSSSGNTLSGNKIANNTCGTLLVSSSNNVLSDNSAANNGVGIYLDSSSNNVLSGDEVTNNGGSIGLVSSSVNTLSSNTVANNGYGILLENSSGNKLSGNNVTANNGYGIQLVSSSVNTLSSNTVANNGGAGVGLSYSSGNTLSGNVMAGNEYSLDVEGSVLNDFLQLVDTSNLADNKPVYYFVNQSDIVVNTDAYQEVGYLGFVNCVNVTVQGMSLTSEGQGLLLAYTASSKITGNNFANNEIGIGFISSSGNTMSGNNIADNTRGILLDSSSGNTLSGNNIANSYEAIELDSSSNNFIFHNSFVNASHVYTEDSANVWDDGFPSGGNYWSDYLARYPNASEINASGIWNTPYVIDSNNTDRYPLEAPYIIPEFSSLLAVPFFMTVTLAVVITLRRKQAKYRNSPHPARVR